MKPTFNQLKAQAKKLGFEEWKKQGRTPEECWAVMNFLTGIGGIRIAEETERARKEERENNESGDIIAQTLVKYSQWLEKNGYMDCDWWAEEPRAVDRFLQTLKEE